VILDVAVLKNAFSVPSKFMVAGIDPAAETSCVLKLDDRLVHHNFGVCYMLGRRPTVVDFSYYAIFPHTPRARGTKPTFAVNFLQPQPDLSTVLSVLKECLVFSPPLPIFYKLDI
jgi:hypothetical protein